MWEIELEHGAEAEEENRDVFRGVAAVVCIDEVDYYQLFEKLASVGRLKRPRKEKKRQTLYPIFCSLKNIFLKLP